MFSTPPDIFIKANEDYAFDYSQYINDIDNDPSELTLSVDDDYASPSELVVTYRYPSATVNEDRIVRLTISDGTSEANVTITVSVTSSGVFGGWGWDSIMLMNFGWLGFLGLAIALFMLFPILKNRRKKFTVEDIFLTHRDGRLIAHYTRELRPDRDEDILAGMLTAVQEFIKDSMGRQEVLKRFEFQMQEKKVLVESGDNVYIAVFTRGEVPQDASEQLRSFLEDVEQAYANVIPDWSGDTNAFKGLKDLMDVLLVGRGYKKGYWKKLKFLGTESADEVAPPEVPEEEKKADEVVDKEIDKFLEELEDLKD
jgi:hypothetical protein